MKGRSTGYESIVMPLDLSNYGIMATLVKEEVG